MKPQWFIENNWKPVHYDRVNTLSVSDGMPAARCPVPGKVPADDGSLPTGNEWTSTYLVTGN